MIDRVPRPVRFVNSLDLGTPPTFGPVRRRIEHHPSLCFKIDATPAWTPALIAELAATEAVVVIDFKGRYDLDIGELPALTSMYERVCAAFPNALLEDPHDLPEVLELLEPEAHRISYDAPIRSLPDIDKLSPAPNAINIKPSRFGDLRSLLQAYAACDARNLVAYGGGMAELDVGRRQIQLLASLFHPDAPNDVAPPGYNTDAPAPQLPSCPLPARPTPWLSLMEARASDPLAVRTRSVLCGFRAALR